VVRRTTADRRRWEYAAEEETHVRYGGLDEIADEGNSGRSSTRLLRRNNNFGLYDMLGNVGVDTDMPRTLRDSPATDSLASGENDHPAAPGTTTPAMPRLFQGFDDPNGLLSAGSAWTIP
jgi:hypothetical protein